MKRKLITLLTTLSFLGMSGCAMATTSSQTDESNFNSESTSLIESSKESSSVSTSEDNSEKTLVIDCTNFNTLDCIDLDGVVENEEFKDKEFTFNSNATLKSKDIKGIKEIIISIYQIYDNLDLFTNYNGTGSAASENKKEGNKELTYTYSFDGINEFCIKNTSATHRTHIFSISITYTGTYVGGNIDGGNNQDNNEKPAATWSSTEFDMFEEYLFTTNIPHVDEENGEWVMDYYEYYGALEYVVSSPKNSNAVEDYEDALVDAGYEFYTTDEYDTNYYAIDTDNEVFYLLVNPYISADDELVIDFYVYGYYFEAESWSDVSYNINDYLGFAANLPECEGDNVIFSYDVTFGGSINVIITSSTPESLFSAYAATLEAASYSLDDSEYEDYGYYYFTSSDESFGIDMSLYAYESEEAYDSIILYIYNL